MEIIYYIVIPIVASILGGLIGGLFTFLGVKLSFRNELKLRKAEQLEKNKEINKEIIYNRAELVSATDVESDIETKEVYLLPYIKPVLEDENTINFEYPNDYSSDEVWNRYEFVIQNHGKREITDMFLQLRYKSMANIYSAEEMYAWKRKSYLVNYYQDTYTIYQELKPGKKLKIIVYYHKGYEYLKNVVMDAYIADEDDNIWYQRSINSIEIESKSEVVAPDAYTMHIREEYYQWFIYDHLYYDKRVKREFISPKMTSLLEDRKKKCWNRDEKHKEFVGKVKKGEIVLNYNYPLNNLR